MSITDEIELYLRYRVKYRENVKDFIIARIINNSIKTSNKNSIKDNWDKQIVNGINQIQMKWNIKKSGTTSKIQVGSIFFALHYGDYVSCHIITKINESCYPEDYWENDDSWQVFYISKEFHRIKWTTWEKNVTSCTHKNNMRTTRRIARTKDIVNLKQLLKLN